jgi:hypothetical protein
MRIERLTVSLSGFLPLPTMPYSAAFGESSHWLEVLLKKILSEVKYSAGSCQSEGNMIREYYLSEVLYRQPPKSVFL